MEKRNIKETAGVQYESPRVEVLDVISEGCFCVSLQQLEEYGGEYEW